jgi:recombinational DNA repair ATPase RecF
MDGFEPRPLHLHTLESMLADLVSGRPILADEGDSFELSDGPSRSALDWYRQRGTSTWAAPVQTQHAEDLVTKAQNEPPTLPEIAPATSATQHRRLKLTKLEAHRFAGLHKFGTPETPPANFVHSFDGPITLLEGRNGSGKTSLLNAIIWVLTGELLRPQREPETAEQEFDCFAEPENEPGQPTAHRLSAVTPMPNLHLYRPLEAAIPIDTWVELTFEDENGNALPPVRRTQSRGRRGVVAESAPELAQLGLDPIGLRIGTLMPSLLGLIRVGKESELGEAVAQLIGISPVVDLSGHAERARRKIAGDLTKEKIAQRDAQDRDYHNFKNQISTKIEENSNLSLPEPISEPSDDISLERSIAALKEHFENAKTQAYQSAKVILGEDFDPANDKLRGDLERNNPVAVSEIDKLSSLPSFSRLRALGNMSEASIAAAENLIETTQTEAKKLEELERDPRRAARERLYARVATWMADHPQPHTEEDRCPICSGSLEHAVDPVTSQSVHQHLMAAAHEGKLLSQTLQQWCQHAAGHLAHSVDETLQPELKRNLPEHPFDLLRTAIVEELFASTAFKGALAPLKAKVASAFDKAIQQSPLAPPTNITLPSWAHAIESELQRLDKAVRFARWRKDNDHSAREVFYKVLGREKKDGEPNDLSTLRGQLLELGDIVSATRPISDIIALSDKLEQAVRSRRAIEKRLTEYEVTVAALAKIATLGKLAGKEVDRLQKTLKTEAAAWRNRIYQGAFPDMAHDLDSTSSGPKGELMIMVRTGGFSAPAQHVTNASALRASLVGFFFAFWHHVYNERGGLKTLLLDDPQELLDDENRERFADAMADLVSAGAQPIITTYDPRFAGRVSRVHGVGTIQHLAVRPATLLHPLVQLTPPMADVMAAKTAFDNDNNDEASARDFADKCRVYFEGVLGTLFEDPAHFQWAKANPHPTLATFLDRIRGLLSANPQDLFAAPIFRRFAQHPALSNGSVTIELMNKCHHGRRHEVRAGDVAACENYLGELLELLEAIQEEAYRWRRRASNDNTSESPRAAPLEVSAFPLFSVPICPELAAFTHAASMHESQEEIERLSETALANKAIFYLRRENFGFAAPQGSLAIIEAMAGPVADRRLVIARDGASTYARRLVRPATGTAVGLTAEIPDPRMRTPKTLFFEESRVELHQVVGIIFDHAVPSTHGQDEAMAVDASDTLRRLQVAFRVKDSSAVPLALEGQVVLGGGVIDLQELGSWARHLVAVTLDDGSSIFKRVGDALPGDLSHLRQFESIGGLGSSEILSVGRNHPGFRTIERARLIFGVLYHG